jgi:hypothetical protein
MCPITGHRSKVVVHLYMASYGYLHLQLRIYRINFLNHWFILLMKSNEQNLRFSLVSWMILHELITLAAEQVYICLCKMKKKPLSQNCTCHLRMSVISFPHANWLKMCKSTLIGQMVLKKSCINSHYNAFLAHLDKGNVSFCHHLASVVC